MKLKRYEAEGSRRHSKDCAAEMVEMVLSPNEVSARDGLVLINIPAAQVKSTQNKGDLCLELTITDLQTLKGAYESWVHRTILTLEIKR